MCHRIPDFNLEKGFWNSIHLVKLDSPFQHNSHKAQCVAQWAARKGAYRLWSPCHTSHFRESQSL